MSDRTAITLSVKTEQLPLVVDALAERGGYHGEEIDGPKPAFAKRVLIDMLVGIVRDHVARQQAQAVDVT